MAAGVMGSAASFGLRGNASGGSKLNVCRCLFGRPSAEDLNVTAAEFRLQQALVIDEKSRQYNFDFRSNKPLTGSYRWRSHDEDWIGEKVASADSTPPTTPPHDDAANQTDSRVEPEVVCGGSSTPVDRTPVAPVLERLLVSAPQRSRKRKTIPDYFPCKKLRSSTPPVKDRDA